MIKKFEKKNFPFVTRACWDKSIDIYNTFHSDQYSHLAIRLNFFSANNLIIEKKSFLLVCRAYQGESIDVCKLVNIQMLYSFCNDQHNLLYDQFLEISWNL